MKSSIEAESLSNDPAMGALSGDPAATIPAQASGLASWLQEPHERSRHRPSRCQPPGAAFVGGVRMGAQPLRPPRHDLSVRAVFRTRGGGRSGARAGAWGAIAAVAGLTVAALAPLLGAIADAGGRRKPWIAILCRHPGGGVAADVVCEAASERMGARLRRRACGAREHIVRIPAGVPQFAAAHDRAANARIARLSGLGLALANAAGMCSCSSSCSIASRFPEKCIGVSFPSHPLFGHRPARRHEAGAACGPGRPRSGC